ncbi:MFS transporter [Kiloniella majae]|uniref:MFS transporter n=1 Tax=Kiloniella majae TaxID=1938558 RepID=UPI000A277443|nr:MFS transporter [Kiloniella majae]
MLTLPILLLMLSVAIVGSNSLVLSPIAGSVALSYDGATASDVMIASAVYGVFTAISALFLAPLVDRFGGKLMLMLSLLLLSVALGVSAMAPTLIILCFAQGLSGAAAGIALPAAYGLATLVAPKGKESETLGVILAGWTLSLIVGVSISAVIAQYVHWRGVYTFMAVLAALVTLSIFATKAWGNPAVKGLPTSPLTALRVPGIGRGLLVCASYMVAFYGLYTYLGGHLQEALGRSTAASGLTTLFYGIGFGGAVLFDRFIDRYGANRIALYVFTGLALTYLSLAFVSYSFYALVFLCLVWGGVNHLGLNLVVGRLIALDKTQQGAILGMNSSVTYLCVFIGAVSFKPVFDSVGFSICALLSALCIVPAIIDGALNRREAMATEEKPT